MNIESRKPCARCGCLSSDIKHKPFGLRGFAVVCPCCGNKAEGVTKARAVTEWNRLFWLGE